MSSVVRYGDWAPERGGWLFGLSGPAWVLTVLSASPLLLAISASNWIAAALCLLGWLTVVTGIGVPVRGRVTAKWLRDIALHQIGGSMGWSSWRSSAAAGQAGDQADLPGVLAGIRVHDGPPFGPMLRRPALVQDLAARTWCVVARISHPGIGMAEAGTRERMGEGLAGLLEGAVTADLVSVIALHVRTVPDDGSERAAWQRSNLRRSAPALALQIDRELSAGVLATGVRTETYVSVRVEDRKIARQVKSAGGGIDGTARVLASLMNELEAGLMGAIGCTQVEWLESPTLAAVIRTGFAPGDRAGLNNQATAFPIAAAGPTHAPAPGWRSYTHDAWSSVTSALLLPQRGAVMGALAPVLTPTSVGERRCVTIFFAPIQAQHADRLVGRAAMSSTSAAEVRHRLGFTSRAAHQRDASRVADTDAQLAGGRALVRTAAVACVTVPSTWPVEDHGRRLEASVRAAGFTALRLDLAQDSGFAAAAIPLGIGLPGRSLL